MALPSGRRPRKPFADAPNGTCRICGRPSPQRRDHPTCVEKWRWTDPKFYRPKILERDQNRCEHCGKKFADEDLQVDHILALRNGGVHGHPALYQTLCAPTGGGGCHREKSATEHLEEKEKSMGRRVLGVTLLVASGAAVVRYFELPYGYVVVWVALFCYSLLGLAWLTGEVKRRRAERHRVLHELLCGETGIPVSRLKATRAVWRDGVPVRVTHAYSPVTWDMNAKSLARVAGLVTATYGVDMKASVTAGKLHLERGEHLAPPEPAEDKFDRLTVKLAKAMGDPVATHVSFTDDSPSQISVTYPSTFDDHVDARRYEVAEIVDSSMPGRWRLEWDTQGNRVVAHRRPEDMPGRIDRPVTGEQMVVPIGPDEDRTVRAWRPDVQAHLLVAGQTGGGKALALDTPVPTLNAGWQTMGSLRRGDTLFDETGAPCRVVEAHPVLLGERCYRVEFSDGTTVVAHGGHLWEVRSRLQRTRGHGESKVLTTEEMAENVLHNEAWSNWSVDVAGALQYPEADLLVDPYVLGIWLGDGSSRTAVVTTADQEVLDELERAGYPTRHVHGPYAYRVGNDLQSKLRTLGVLGDKHIPRAYMEASPAQRMALLHGLMDSDGTCSKKSHACEFDNTNEVLIRQVYRLLTGLGFKVGLSSRTATYSGRDCGKSWRLKWTTDVPMFRLARKRAHQPLSTRATSGRRYVTAITEVESVPVRCVTVDSPSSLFLVSDACIPTHNSVLISGVTAHCLTTGWEAIIADGKGTTLAGFRHWPGVIDYGFGEAEAMSRALLRAEKIMTARYREIYNNDASPDQFQPLLVVMDEATLMMAKLEGWWKATRDKGDPQTPPAVQAWKDIAVAGREARVHLVLGIQQAAAGDFDGTQIRDQFGCRIALGPTTPEAARMMFRDSHAGNDVPTGLRGRATVAIPEGRMEVQCYYFAELLPSGAARNEDDEGQVRQWRMLAERAHPAPESEKTRPARVHELSPGDQFLCDEQWARVVSVDPAVDAEDDEADVEYERDGRHAVDRLAWDEVVTVLDSEVPSRVARDGSEDDGGRSSNTGDG